MNYSELATPFGMIGVSWQGQQLSRVLLAPDLASESAHQSAPELDQAASHAQARSKPETPAWLRAELEAYFADPRHRIRCGLEPAGTSFQRSVWALIAAIPAGSHRTYGSLAKQLQSSARAVGNACRANPVPLCVPCHRVIASRGLGGFAGDRSGRLIEIKRWLLDHEAALHSGPPVPDGLFAARRAQ
ncbi:methylated-DNA--[protein]-cysteine S-methyltransferase [Halochromatium sp.]